MIHIGSLLIGFILQSTAYAAPTWAEVEAVKDWDTLAEKRHKVAGTVSVFNKEVSGTPCFRAIASTKASPSIMMEVATDIIGSMKWSTAGLTRSEVLGRNGTSIDYLQYVDVPAWTFSSDRFWVLRGTTSQQGAEHQFTWHRIGENGGPYSAKFLKVQEETGAIEPPVNVGGWEFIPQESTTLVRYTICTDSGGSVPRGVQNMATKTTLPDTVGDLIRESLKRSQ